mmetsp:Transcript_51308/g.135136  ORF Transcript_51308/g.135136 Transcript_51308/m.135136 type:complete len:349 (-) Transcript_51308:1062-2108(-)
MLRHRAVSDSVASTTAHRAIRPIGPGRELAISRRLCTALCVAGSSLDFRPIARLPTISAISGNDSVSLLKTTARTRRPLAPETPSAIHRLIGDTLIHRTWHRLLLFATAIVGVRHQESPTPWLKSDLTQPAAVRAVGGERRMRASLESGIGPHDTDSRFHVPRPLLVATITGNHPAQALALRPRSPVRPHALDHLVGAFMLVARGNCNCCPAGTRVPTVRRLQHDGAMLAMLTATTLLRACRPSTPWTPSTICGVVARAWILVATLHLVERSGARLTPSPAGNSHATRGMLLTSTASSGARCPLQPIRQDAINIANGARVRIQIARLHVHRAPGARQPATLRILPNSP